MGWLNGLHNSRRLLCGTPVRGIYSTTGFICGGGCIIYENEGRLDIENYLAAFTYICHVQVTFSDP